MRRLLVSILAFTSVAALAAHGDVTRMVATLRSLAEPLLGHGDAIAPRFDTFYAGMVEALPPQEHTERALELAIDNYQGAADYVVERAQTWRGQFKPSHALDALLHAALNSRRIEVRMAAFELSLAEYNLQKTPAEIDHLLARRASDPQGSGPWALWNISLIGARGGERERIYAILVDALRDTDETQRRWAVDALARFGGEEVVDPLLAIAAHDASSEVQERAFCGLAQSGTLQLAERYRAVPGLLAIAEDQDASAQQRTWVFQALREITETYDVPEDVSAWRVALDRAGLLAG
ncbi:MAG: HEAT repeat domain-containing protein [Dokdonella sp.]